MKSMKSIPSEIHEIGRQEWSQPPRRVAEKEKELQHNLGCTHQEFDTEKGTIGPTVHEHAVLEPKSGPNNEISSQHLQETWRFVDKRSVRSKTLWTCCCLSDTIHQTHPKPMQNVPPSEGSCGFNCTIPGSWTSQPSTKPLASPAFFCSSFLGCKKTFFLDKPIWKYGNDYGKKQLKYLFLFLFLMFEFLDIDKHFNMIKHWSLA